MELVIVIVVAVVILVYLGHIKLPGNVTLDRRYNANTARFQTPGRNARQQQLSLEKSDRQKRREEEVVVLGNYKGDDGVQSGSEMEGAGGGYVEHPELARRVKDERAIRAAAAEARMKRDKDNAQVARRILSERKACKGKSALEQASAENVGWRGIDQVREMRSYN